MLKRDRRGGVEILTIDREGAGNSMNSGTSIGFNDALDGLEQDGGLRAVVVTGAGERFFCAGGDIKEYAEVTTDDALHTTFDRTRRALDRLEGLPVPVIAAVNGYALGGGAELMLACDWRVAAPHARIGLTQVRLGIIPAWNGIERLVRDCGPRVGLKLATTGEELSAERAKELGLIDEIATDRTPLEAALAYAEALEAAGPLALAAAKRVALAAAYGDYDKARALTRAETAALWFTEDHREAEAAFKEKRKPVFRGA